MLYEYNLDDPLTIKYCTQTAIVPSVGHGRVIGAKTGTLCRPLHFLPLVLKFGQPGLEATGNPSANPCIPYCLER